MLQVEGSAEGPKKTHHVKRQGLQKNLQMNESKQKRSNKQVESLTSMGPETYLERRVLWATLIHAAEVKWRVKQMNCTDRHLWSQKDIHSGDTMPVRIPLYYRY